MSESAPLPEPAKTPETLSYLPLRGLQGRLETGGPALFPTVPATVKETDLGKHNPATLSLMGNASNRERDGYWKQKPGEKQYDAQMNAWKDSFVSSVKESFGTPKQIAQYKDYFQALGIDLAHFDDNSAQSFYDQFFNGSGTDSDVALFVAKTLKTVQKPDGSYDETRLASYLPAIKWVANTFGGNSAELTAQMIDAEIARTVHPDIFAAETNACVNTLTNREKDLLTFLTEGQTPPKNPTPPEPGHTPEPQPKPEQEATKEQLDQKIEMLAAYLTRLDAEATGVSVDPATGKISHTALRIPPPTNPELAAYDKKLQELRQSFAARNAAAVEKLKKTPGILDVQEIMGAVVVTYDSSRQTPPDSLGVAFLGPDDSRAGYSKTSDFFLGLVEVDLNVGKRDDKVAPSVSATHELRHHALSMSDYLLTTDPTMPMASGYRKGRNEHLFGKDGGMTDERFAQDLPLYEKALGRPLTTADILPIRKQLAYLDELHSSFMQKKPVWFEASADVYAELNKGKHWELVGGHPADIEASKHLFSYSQGFLGLSELRQLLISRGKPTPEQQKFIDQCESVYAFAGAIIGAGRSVQQTERLIASLWADVKHAFPDIMGMTELRLQFKKQEKNGVSLPGCAAFLLST